MAKNTMQEKISCYKETAQRRWLDEQQKVAERKRAAQRLGQDAANMLRQEFNATEVVLFGSLAHGEWFTSTSDIDLAASGIPKAEYFRAVALLQGLSTKFRIDLVDLDNCKPSLLASVNREGIQL